jgi:type 1 fimbriae regulatory protein FimB/type 1 fimbriae regulatory protein FimE
MDTARKLPPFLTQDETKRLFETIRKSTRPNTKRDRALFLTAYRHGLRASEVGLLQKADVDFKSSRLTIHRLKNSISGIYPIQPDEQKTLKAYIATRTDSSPYLFLSKRGVPIDRRTLWLLTRTYGKAAKLPPDKLHFHVLRHSIATHLLDAGADLSFVKDWLGHANIQNTTIYARLTTATRDDQARKIFASHRVV